MSEQKRPQARAPKRPQTRPLDALADKDILTVEEVRHLFCRSDVMLWQAMHSGLFPPPLCRNSSRDRRRWSGAAVRQWVADQVAGVRRDWRVEWRDYQGAVDPSYDAAKRTPPRTSLLANAGAAA